MLYHKIATGYVKSETRSLIKEDSRFHEEVHRLVLREASASIAAGRKLEKFQMRAMSKQLQSGLDGSPNVFWTRYHPAPRTLSSTLLAERLQAALLTFNIHNGAPMLGRMRYQIQPRRFLHAIGIAPIEIRQHAFQRMLQRSDGRQDAVRFMLEQAEARMGLLCMMLAPGSALPQRSIAFPMGDGLLLGNIVHQLFGDPANDLLEFMDIGRNGVTTQMDMSIRRPAMLHDDTNQPLGFLAKTYIGPSEMRPSQKHLHECLVAIANEHAADLEGIADLSYFADDILILGDAEFERRVEAIDTIQSKVTDVFMQGRFARAMGNENSPATRPEPSIQRRRSEDEKAKRQFILEQAMRNAGVGQLPGLT